MNSETDFNSIQFEKKLTNLKDSQDSINVCCLWCLENRQHHKKIVSTWLNVLKRVRIEQRLTLFYLANDVIQYSKRKSYEYVESWGTALQKATTMVRDEKVKHKILRIFKIWEQRGIYGEEFITDLSGLISASPSAKKVDESHEFQPSYLVNKIRTCSKLEADTDHKLKLFKQQTPVLLDGDALVASLKDREHVDEVEKELDDYVNHMNEYVNALKLEMKARNNLINLLLTAETQLEKDRKDVKVVAVAYKSFATRVKNLKKKLDEKKQSLNSPIPSPDINAPSPSPDSDIDLPEIDTPTTAVAITKNVENFSFSNAGFYNPVTSAITDTSNSFANNGFSSFMGPNMPFNMQNINAASLFSGNSNEPSPVAPPTQNADNNYITNSLATLFPSISQPPPPPAPAIAPTPNAPPTPVPPVTTTNYQYNNSMPLAPPPLPPFTKSDSMYNTDGMYNEYTGDQNTSYGDANFSTQQPTVNPYQSTNSTYNSSYTNSNSAFPSNVTQTFEPIASATVNQSYSYDPYNPDDYNPEEEPETWESEEQWDQPPALDTPASPPPLDKESFLDPIVYHDGDDVVGAVDIDHRVLNVLSNKSALDKKKDVDHRNLISLTGSPKNSCTTPWPSKKDQDYRIGVANKSSEDRDYRMTFPMENFNLPPPPPPPTTPSKKINSLSQSPKKLQDNTESIDMELSDDEVEEVGNSEINNQNVNEGVLPPPPFPDEEDATDFLNSLHDELNLDDINYENENYDDFEETEEPEDESTWKNNINVPLNEPPPPIHGSLLGDHPSTLINICNWSEVPPAIPFQTDMRMRGRGRGNRGHFGNNRGEFNNRGNFRGRVFRGMMPRGRGGWGMDPRGNPRYRGRGRGRPWGFIPRGNFRGGFVNNF